VSCRLHLHKYGGEVLHGVRETLNEVLARTALSRGSVIDGPIDVTPSPPGLLRSYQHPGACDAKRVEQRIVRRAARPAEIDLLRSAGIGVGKKTSRL